jgi:hypothetical protein
MEGWRSAFIAQTGRIPAGTKSLQMLARGQFEVLINGVSIAMKSNGELYWGDVSAFADTLVELRIVSPGTRELIETVVDNIVFLPEETPADTIEYRGGIYTQDFNSLPGGVPNQINTRMPDGWKLWPDEFYWTSVTAGLNPTYFAYSVSETAASSDKAFALFSGETRSQYLGVHFRNASPTTLTSFTISYWIEQWSKGLGLTDFVIYPFEYSLVATNLRWGTFIRSDAGGIASVTDQNESSPDRQPLNGNDQANRRLITTTISGISWAPGQSLWLRWLKDREVSYFYEVQLLAIDDFTFTAVPSLQLVRALNGSIRLSWSTNHPGFRLQSRINLSGDNWTDVSQPPARTGEQFEVTLDQNDAQRFFRLVQ